MQDFEFYAPRSLEDALRYLAEKGESCRIIAGGTDLIPALRNETTHPGYILNILEIDGLKGIAEGQEEIRIGPTTTFTEMMRSEILKTHLPLLVEAASWVGGPSIRNRGTIGGNLCNASPAADVLPAVVALDGRMELQSVHGEVRVLPVAEAVESPYRTRIRHDEILTAVRIRKLPLGTRYAFEKVARRKAMARAYMSVSIVLCLGDDGLVTDVRIVLGAVEAMARRVKAAEDVLMRRRPDENLIQESAEALARSLAGVWIPEYKMPVLRFVFKRNLRNLL
jgi:CO/xanthine dehydrogenase FAD-binding subunit